MSARPGIGHRPGIGRRTLLRAATATSALLLSGCDRLSESDWFRQLLGLVNEPDRKLQRALAVGSGLAPEYTAADLSPNFRVNGNDEPDDAAYQAFAANQFRDWKLEIGGLVERPAQLSLADLRAFPSRTQITRHDCVEGWTCIGKWKGARLSAVLNQVGLKPQARFLVFRCADAFPGPDGPQPYYESIDLNDAFHEQTILAYDMNDQVLPVSHGAPIRLRAERHLGYKQAKFVMKIEAVESFAKIGDGNGSYWADQGYAWYAGI